MIAAVPRHHIQFIKFVSVKSREICKTIPYKTLPSSFLSVIAGHIILRLLTTSLSLSVGSFMEVEIVLYDRLAEIRGGEISGGLRTPGETYGTKGAQSRLDQ